MRQMKLSIFKPFYLISVLLALVACTSNGPRVEMPSKEKPKKNQTRNGLVVEYFPKTEIKASEITYVENIKNGPARSFYRNGQVNKEGYYVDGLKHGVFVTFYENGKRKKSVEYKENKHDGWDSTFYKSGNPKSAVLYKMDEVQPGTVEWDRFRKKHTTDNIIKVESINRIATHGECAVFAKLKDGYRAEYIEIAYIGTGTVEKPEYEFTKLEWTDNRKEEAQFIFDIPRGYEYVGKLAFRAKGKTKNKKPFVSYELYPVVFN